MLSEDEQTQELISLFKKGTKLTYKKGEFIIRPGDTPSHVYYIEEGLVKAYNISKYGEENMLIVRKKHFSADLGYNRPGKRDYLPSAWTHINLAHRPRRILSLLA
jgi:CRP-like cAMP-binding protein